MVWAGLREALAWDKQPGSLDDFIRSSNYDLKLTSLAAFLWSLWITRW
jgi:hypothetical protein